MFEYENNRTAVICLVLPDTCDEMDEKQQDND
jgi:hypothetical protein